MKPSYKWTAALVAVILTVSAASAMAFSWGKKDADAAKGDKKAPTVVEQGWQKRCADDPKTKKKQCEVFQRIDVKESKMRIAEFAVGYPDMADKSTARGVVILPLGMLLEQPAVMKLDDSAPVSFKPRFCSNGGCFSYVNLKGDLFEQVKKAKKVTFTFKSPNGQDVNIIMTMDGLTKALAEI